ncbi:type 1 fimbrial protein [Enterobacter hormaechei]|uniref:Type 1 fimbrial protein n=1 Tax=Enterobacter hormaechei TaxID=158836 RepID=A0AAN4DN78_9ENTR|nr:MULTISPECIES: type 1 fimbrial protein [Enterobacter]UAS96127.1 type 1 fimbrial protein [Enterobacter cloacae complex sp.]AJB70553.1 hypothetical protein LI64_08365 [Enterobacter hormaechei subsp. hormaechei]EGK63230.1 hypothetical protein HMPREF9086_0812 [Enterobacter hormaechei ATCC 49162]EGQ5283071.1 type 1 fimbrial protein [Enterobacter hormaechei]EGQ5286266.1 type 1 fimbrial protein [Enterobacter hormaechei]
MFKSAASIISGLGLLLSSIFSPAYSATLVNGGVIHFRGAVVADPCEVTPRHQQFAISCPKNNRMETHTISYDEALRGHRTQSDLAAVTMKYLNEKKTLAVVQVDYR